MSETPEGSQPPQPQEPNIEKFANPTLSTPQEGQDSVRAAKAIMGEKEFTAGAEEARKKIEALHGYKPEPIPQFNLLQEETSETSKKPFSLKNFPVIGRFF